MKSASKALVLIALFSLLGIVEAHSPYTERIAVLKDPSGRPLILEYLYGDGIVVADPATLQIRNRYGAVIAYSPTGYRMAHYCPSLTTCWAFPYNGPLIQPWRLDYRHLNYEERPQQKPSLKPHPEAFSDEHKGFVPGDQKLELLSPLIILWDNLLAFFILTVINFGFAALLAFVCKGFNSKQGVKKVAFLISGIFPILLSFGFIGVFSLLCLITFSIPLVYCVIVAVPAFCLGLVLPKLCRAKPKA